MNITLEQFATFCANFGPVTDMHIRRPGSFGSRYAMYLSPALRIGEPVELTANALPPGTVVVLNWQGDATHAALAAMGAQLNDTDFPIVRPPGPFTGSADAALRIALQ